MADLRVGCRGQRIHIGNWLPDIPRLHGLGCSALSSPISTCYLFTLLYGATSRPRGLVEELDLCSCLPFLFVVNISEYINTSSVTVYYIYIYIKFFLILDLCAGSELIWLFLVTSFIFNQPAHVGPLLCVHLYVTHFLDETFYITVVCICLRFVWENVMGFTFGGSF